MHCLSAGYLVLILGVAFIGWRGPNCYQVNDLTFDIELSPYIPIHIHAETSSLTLVSYEHGNTEISFPLQRPSTIFSYNNNS